MCNPADTVTANCSTIWQSIGLPAYSAAASGKTAICHDRYESGCGLSLSAAEPRACGQATPQLSARINVGVIEKLTGLKFFTALAADKRDALVDKCEPTTLWPAAVPAKKKPN